MGKAKRESSRDLSYLRRQIRELQALNATKDEFIALASHQLRTPATGVKQYLGMVLEGYVGKLTAAQKDYLLKAYENNERQIATINDLLQVAQIDGDKIVLDRVACDVKEIVTMVIREFRAVTEDRQQKMTLRNTRKPVIVWADKLRLRIALDNILDNASKYSNEGTNITISVRTQDNNVMIAVTDNGVGISEADFDKLFQKFTRLDNPRSIIAGGNGLGLYLAKQIVVAHQGDILVTSTLGKGSTFTIKLPIYHDQL